MLNANDVAALLAVAGGYDNRRPGELNVHAWQEASDRGHWSLDEATEAVHKHYETKTDFVLPAHITAIVRNARLRAEELERQQRMNAEHLLAPGVWKTMKPLYADALSNSKAQSANQRAMVLAHPDLAQKLTEPPLSFERPEDWNGWVPPERDSNGQVNDSPRARALGHLIGEAQYRDRRTA